VLRFATVICTTRAARPPAPTLLIERGNSCRFLVCSFQLERLELETLDLWAELFCKNVFIAAELP
jgi:hypothetical protein